MPAESVLVIYLVIGAGVSVVVYLSEGVRSPIERGFGVATALLFWPLYLPLLLARGGRFPLERTAALSPPAQDEMSAAIDQVDGELAAALSSLDGWAEDVLAREKGRFRELRAAWTAQAARIRDMDRLLALPEYVEAVPAEEEPAVPGGGSDRLRQSLQARRHNIARLRQVRRQAHDDLMATLAWVRELVSMIHLAKFTGAPASRAEELVAQIAAAVEGISETTWRYEGDGTPSLRSRLPEAPVPGCGPDLQTGNPPAAAAAAVGRSAPPFDSSGCPT